MKKWIALLSLLAAGCVNVDPETGATLPRGDQKYAFETVVRRAEKLREGMVQTDVRILLGSPAEMSADRSTWIYLPERPAVLVPSRALKVEFKDGILVRHGFSPIVLGQPL